MASKWFFITIGVILLGYVVAVLMGQRHESTRADRLVETLRQSVPVPVVGAVNFSSFAELPAPVARYFRHVLTDGQQIIKVARIRQTGVLRTSTTSDSWP